MYLSLQTGDINIQIFYQEMVRKTIHQQHQQTPNQLSKQIQSERKFRIFFQENVELWFWETEAVFRAILIRSFESKYYTIIGFLPPNANIQNLWPSTKSTSDQFIWHIEIENHQRIRWQSNDKIIERHSFERQKNHEENQWIQPFPRNFYLNYGFGTSQKRSVQYFQLMKLLFSQSKPPLPTK